MTRLEITQKGVLTKVCLACQTEGFGNNKFCPACGKELQDAAWVLALGKHEETDHKYLPLFQYPDIDSPSDDEGFMTSESDADRFSETFHAPFRKTELIEIPNGASGSVTYIGSDSAGRVLIDGPAKVVVIRESDPILESVHSERSTVQGR